MRPPSWCLRALSPPWAAKTGARPCGGPPGAPPAVAADEIRPLFSS
ncbi:hypothetical protein STXM2123_439 [Streptomyces sp. F-3]|nr:hypothetical protein STXM2123_439 [Streptomyces sp. F-3]